MDHQNKCVGNSSVMSDAAKSFDILASLNVVHNHFDGSTKLFSNLYLAKFLNTSAKLFFPYVITNTIAFASFAIVCM